MDSVWAVSCPVKLRRKQTVADALTQPGDLRRPQTGGWTCICNVWSKTQANSRQDIFRSRRKAKSLARKSAGREATGMILSVWVQYSWTLKNLPVDAPPVAARYTVESATLDDRPLLFAAVSRSLSMEPSWSVDLTARVKLADELINSGLPAGEVAFVAIKHGARVIATSAIRDSGDKISNLPLGICVLNEYRCRGLGTYLLYESLRRLRDRGLEEARLVTKKGLPADRYLYPKFGGQRAVLSTVPA
jgi:GNAT superfamily N-acetyltransferase